MPTNGGAAVVFLGPTMPRAEARSLFEAEYSPPAQQGDIYAAGQSRPAAIVLIDGYFNWTPSVWHKEILWCLSHGIPVYGASSMGALRACELHSFGMVGHGRIFEDYLSGTLEDDDEVALVHHGADRQFKPLSDAMVNIRCTLAEAERTGIISSAAHQQIIRFYKNLFFADRLLGAAASYLAGLPEVAAEEATRLVEWLPAHYQDLKRRDAESLLRLLAAGAEHPAHPTRSFVFHSTINWQQLTESVNLRRSSEMSQYGTAVDLSDSGTDDLIFEALLEGAWPDLEAAALARVLAERSGPKDGAVREDEFLHELAQFCVQFEIEEPEDLSPWLESRQWPAGQFSESIAREVLVRRAREFYAPDVRNVARELLRLTGREGPLMERARCKRRWLDSIGGREALMQSDPAAPLQWYRRRMGWSANKGLQAMAMEGGWPSVSDMVEELIIEHAYRRRMEPALPE